VAKIWRFATFLPHFGKIKVNMRPLFRSRLFAAFFISFAWTYFNDDYRIPSRRGWRCHRRLGCSAGRADRPCGVAERLPRRRGPSRTPYAMRGELQDPHFDTDWFDYVAVLPPSMQ
jgi:hypothetical protein